MDYTTAIILIILLALVFWLAYFGYISKLKFSYIVGFIIGGVGWTIALFLRLPILTYIQNLVYVEHILPPIVILIVGPAFAGIFEESFRYLFAKKWNFINKTNGEVIGFGIGWGVFEILLIHTLTWINIMMLIMLGIDIPGLTPLPTPDALFWMGIIGSYERNMAVAFHISLTIIIAKALVDRKYLIIAIILHALGDFLVVLSVGYIGIWGAEGLLTVIVIVIYLYIYKVMGMDLKELFLKSDESIQL